MTNQKTFAETLNSIRFEYKAHILATISLLISGIFYWLHLDLKLIQQSLLLISLLGFAFGFLAWSLPFIAKAWHHPIGAAIITVFHVFVLILSTIFARHIVASSIGLPPQDFDITVGIISIISYIPAWSIIISIILGASAIILEIISFGAMVTNCSFRTVAKHFARMFGAIAALSISTNIFDYSLKNEEALHTPVKWIAYFCDFQPAPMYPGILKEERIRLHENGIISFAHIENGEIQVKVKKYVDE